MPTAHPARASSGAFLGTGTAVPPWPAAGLSTLVDSLLLSPGVLQEEEAVVQRARSFNTFVGIKPVSA